MTDDGGGVQERRGFDDRDGRECYAMRKQVLNIARVNGIYLDIGMDNEWKRVCLPSHACYSVL
jgi:hypothetical protein